MCIERKRERERYASTLWMYVHICIYMYIDMYVYTYIHHAYTLTQDMELRSGLGGGVVVLVPVRICTIQVHKDVLWKVQKRIQKQKPVHASLIGACKVATGKKQQTGILFLRK